MSAQEPDSNASTEDNETAEDSPGTSSFVAATITLDTDTCCESNYTLTATNLEPESHSTSNPTTPSHGTHSTDIHINQAPGSHSMSNSSNNIPPHESHSTPNTINSNPPPPGSHSTSKIPPPPPPYETLSNPINQAPETHSTLNSSTQPYGTDSASNLTNNIPPDVTQFTSNPTNPRPGSQSSSNPTNPPPSPVQPRRGVWGATAAMRWAKIAQAKKLDENTEKSSLKSVAKRVSKQVKAKNIITRWANMTPLGRFAKDEEHLTFIRDAARQTSMDIPAPIQHCIREEAIVILQDTLKQYRAELGAHHPLTEEMQRKIDEMRDKITTCTPKDHKRHNFLKRLSTVFLGSDHHPKV